MRAARNRVRRYCARARVVGVAFFDFLHQQTGRAPNGIELQPILGFACLAGASVQVVDSVRDDDADAPPVLVVEDENVPNGEGFVRKGFQAGRRAR
jgi:hypothetical protein